MMASPSSEKDFFLRREKNVLRNELLALEELHRLKENDYKLTCRCVERILLLSSSSGIEHTAERTRVTRSVKGFTDEQND
jgi:hypothetical protein